jgi:maltose alpha-D-glucosyltransferase/alpha-amylase
MVRSLHYAGQTAAHRVRLEFGSFEPDRQEQLENWLSLWHQLVSDEFLSSYLEEAHASPYLPATDDVSCLLEFFRLEKAMYELGYEVNTRPTWVDIPARGILDLLDVES